MPYLTQREHDGSALSHFFLVLVHFSQARCARSTASSMGESELRGSFLRAVTMSTTGTSALRESPHGQEPPFKKRSPRNGELPTAILSSCRQAWPTLAHRNAQK